MAADAFINCRVTSETKALLRSLADRQGITESAFVKDLLGVALRDAASTDQPTPTPDRVSRTARLYLRLEPGDWTLLRERANARRMRVATYASVQLRSHLRGIAPLPKAEYLAFKQAVAQLSAIGRNLNQIARAVNQGERTPLPGMAEVGAMLKVAVALRDHMKALLTANERAWRDGHPETPQTR